MRLWGRVLAIAGVDSGGGAGIAADIRASLAMGAYCSTAVTALTAQDTRGVAAVLPVPADFLARQITMALADPGADAVKTGMLGGAAAIEAVAGALASCRLPVVVDPVMIAKGGAALLEDGAMAALRTLLLPRATLLTPNLPEAEALTGRPVRTAADMPGAAAALRALGAEAVLVKGGHLAAGPVLDLLMTPAGVWRFEGSRLQTRHTHGTGCTLASAIAAGLAQGRPLPGAVGRAVAYVRRAIRTAPGFGAGHGPLNHAAGLARRE
jgi:hydroxymethylpyrimidine/phosphomethylpyrimidine kinase